MMAFAPTIWRRDGEVGRERSKFGRPQKLTDALICQVILAHDDPATTVPETCRVLGISKSSYYAALRAGRSEFRQEAA